MEQGNVRNALRGAKDAQVTFPRCFDIHFNSAKSSVILFFLTANKDLITLCHQLVLCYLPVFFHSEKKMS